jgi:hypothetical protein
MEIIGECEVNTRTQNKNNTFSFEFLAHLTQRVM